jgi:DNA helicase-2/ATP-dependent DNA helicase PcrA
VTEEIAARRSSAMRHYLRDFAVLYRTNAQSRALEEAMRKRAIPYRLIGAVRFYDRREIRDLMSYLKLIANPADDEAFRRAVSVPKRGLGDTTIDALADAAREGGVPLLTAASRPELLPGVRAAARTGLADFAVLVTRLRERAREAAVDELLRELIDAIRYGDYLKAEGPESAERLENVRELITGAAETVADEGGEVGLTPLDHFLQKATLIAGVDHLDPNADAVTMMTLHNAKGLEFPVVFLTGLEDGLFPLAKAYDDPALLEEERRLFYVGITRAEQRLYLAHAEQRRRNGEYMQCRPSSFLLDLPREMVEQRRTVKARSSGRSFMAGLGSGYGQAGDYSRSSVADRGAFPPGAAARRPGTPVTRPEARGAARPAPFADEAEASQDAPVFTVGARVKHRKFGSGTIAELSGTGRDAKVKIDFDDESVGRKTLVVAQANLERGWE